VLGRRPRSGPLGGGVLPPLPRRDESLASNLAPGAQRQVEEGKLLQQEEEAES